MFKTDCYEKYHKNIAALFNEIRKICQQSSGTRGQIIHMRLSANYSFYKFLCLLTAFAGIAYVYHPLKSFIIDGELVSLLPLEFIFIDQSTTMGFIVANISMAGMASFAITGIAYIALNFFIIIMSFAPLVDVIQIDFDELDELWCKPSTSDCSHRRRFLQNICQKCIDMRGYECNQKILFSLFLTLEQTTVG